MAGRQLKDFGIQPLTGSLLIAVAFVGISLLLFARIPWAVYVYMLLALGAITMLNSRQRNSFLKTCFSAEGYYKIRLVENILVALPFCIFLFCKMFFIIPAILLAAALLLVFINFDSSLQFTLPTPFYKKPFELTVGFRKLFWFFLACYALAAIAITVRNYNLGIFSLVAVFLLCLSCYSETEPAYFVWVFALTPKQFLWEKIKTACLQSTLLCLPVAIALSIFFFMHIYVTLGFLVLGYIYLTTLIAARYAGFPAQVNLTQMLLLALSMGLPPLVLVIGPYFYFQSLKKLETIL